MMFQDGKCWGYGDWPVRQDQTCDSWTQSQEQLAKEAEAARPEAQAAIDALAAGDPSALQDALTALYGDSYLQGTHDAAHAAGGAVVASLTDVSLQPDAAYWDKWAPGYGEAAAQAADGGLKELLDQADITIQGMTDTSVERIGNAIADGLEAGDSYQTTAKTVRDVVEDPERADTIANTEYNRAMTTASVETYKDAGVDEVEWMAEADACEECEANAAASPYPLDGGEEPPQHPNCRCALAPVVSESDNSEPEAEGE
jgi:SPP1 gp7 family putative phage head morphogenesis protein